MHAFKLIPAAALLCALAACGSDDDAAETEAPAAPKTPAVVISKADADALRAEIYPLWNPPAEPPCHAQLKIRIDLAEDGSVVRADAKPELAFDDPCRGAQDAAIRAIWAASPLDVPRHREWNSLTLIFDRDALM
ncbi:hypothetical protein [Dongia sedimenti]|uniref:TonB C-terminal domain-containing protein n=1 Tax=Dongia sedimenti TaxID=3064282 RepID=A0ABU0YSF9_9PROT|nr:hypothetical protein [Rhodospirillaceae bacterium R-7]